MSSSDERAELLTLFRQRSLRRGEFTLASGATSSYYIDARVTTMAGRGQMLIGRLGLAAIDAAGWSPDVVGGLTLGADPVAYAVAHAATAAGRRLDAFTVRKKAKEHGTGRRVEGAALDGAAVVVVEDVVTSGASALEAARVVGGAGGHVLGVLAVVDREEGGRGHIEDAGYRLVSLLTASELLAD